MEIRIENQNLSTGIITSKFDNNDRAFRVCSITSYKHEGSEFTVKVSKYLDGKYVLSIEIFIGKKSVYILTDIQKEDYPELYKILENITDEDKESHIRYASDLYDFIINQNLIKKG